MQKHPSKAFRQGFSDGIFNRQCKNPYSYGYNSQMYMQGYFEGFSTLRRITPHETDRALPKPHNQIYH